ncbi:hypothetical protein GCM10009712_09840 [Pseudarthrobacter sulfonivorans]
MPRQPKKSPAPAPRPGKEPAKGSASHSESDQTQEEILAYWTPQRMAEAKPREIRLPEPASSPKDDNDPAPNNS